MIHCSNIPWVVRLPSKMITFFSRGSHPKPFIGHYYWVSGFSSVQPQICLFPKSGFFRGSFQHTMLPGWVVSPSGYTACVAWTTRAVNSDRWTCCAPFCFLFFGEVKWVTLHQKILKWRKIFDRHFFLGRVQKKPNGFNFVMSNSCAMRPKLQ